MPAPLFRMARVRLELDGKVALKRVDWEVQEGESWAVIGPNGAGKTSLLSIINGYRWPSEGEVSILGKRFGETDLRELRMQVGIVSSYLNGMVAHNETVLDLVVSGKFGATRLFRRSTNEDREYATSLLRALACEELAAKKVEELSQGERQKVMIARALMPRPRLLTLDEPCEGLDLRARETFLSGLGSLAMERRTTIVDVTHRTDEIPAGFTHALLLKDGKVLSSGRIAGTLTSRNMTACFNVGVTLRRWEGRYYSVVKKG